jgi:hypothetical protein
MIVMFLQPIYAQDVDYYQSEEERNTAATMNLKELYRWGPKLGIEAWGSVGYSHFYTPSTISGIFQNSAGGFGYDIGVGPRIRIYHKLAVAFGFQFSGRGYSMGLPATAEIDTGTSVNGGGFGSGTAIIDIDVDEQMNLQYVGFYIKPVIELSRKFHLAVIFHPSWELVKNRKGTSKQTIVGGPSNLLGATASIPDESSFELELKQFELGLEFAYKWNIAPQLILKPHLGIYLATSAIFHTGAELPTPFGPWEQNPSFMTLRFGVVFETGLWMDKM